jgi:Flp pilus assembly pilin Flp
MTDQLLKFWNEDHGQDIVEYSLLITFIAIACMYCLGWGHASMAGIWGVANQMTTRGAAAASASGG